MRSTGGALTSADSPPSMSRLQLPIDLADQALQRDAGLETAAADGRQHAGHDGPKLLDLLAGSRPLEVRGHA